MRRGALGIVGYGCLLMLAAAPGCTRRAPGPAECYEFARSLIGVPKRAVILPDEVGAVVESEAVRCLTTPYDRALIACVEAGTGKRRCQVEFELRTEPRRETDER
jgi:hypothetical protein